MSLKTFYTVVLLFLLFALQACQKELNVKIQSSDPQLVVQGGIETGRPPYVVLTTTIGTFSSFSLADVSNLFVHNAKIQVGDGSKTITLREYAVDTADGAKFYIYTIDTAMGGGIMLGEEGKFYTLKIESGGVTYTSTTKIPYPKGLDTLWFGEPTFKRAKTPAGALELFGTYTDPDTPGNYVRYYTRRNSRDAFYAGGLYSDEVVNGSVIRGVDLFAGYNDSVNVNKDSLRYFYVGDTVTLKWCVIDKGVYNFWNTYLFSTRSSANPFSSPINIQSNIKGGALGVWAGYGTIYTTLVVK